MASMVLQQQPPQQQQQQQQQQFNTTSTSQDGDLINALAKYVTTGVGARHTTQSELQEMIQSTVSQPGGRAHLESLCQYGDSHLQATVWKDKARADGTITLSKTGLRLAVTVSSLDISFSGDAAGFFRPGGGSLMNGTLYYLSMDNLQPGDAVFKLHVDNLTLHVDIYRNQVHVASLVSGPVGFTLAPGIQEGSGKFGSVN